VDIPVRLTVVEGEPCVSVVLAKLTTGPAGLTVPVRLTSPVKVPIQVAVRLPDVITSEAGQAATTGAGLLKLKPFGGGVIVITALLISKKIFRVSRFMGILKTVQLQRLSICRLGTEPAGFIWFEKFLIWRINQVK